MTPMFAASQLLEAQERFIGYGFQAAEAWVEWTFHMTGWFGQLNPPVVWGRDESADGMRKHLPTGADLEDHYGRRAHDIDVKAV